MGRDAPPYRRPESLVLGKLSTGAADDLDKAAGIARNMAMRYGMDKKLGRAIHAVYRPRFLEGVIRPPGMDGNCKPGDPVRGGAAHTAARTGRGAPGRGVTGDSCPG